MTSTRVKIDCMRSMRPKEFTRTQHLHTVIQDDHDRFLANAIPTMKTGTLVDIHAKCQLNQYERVKYKYERTKWELEQDEEKQRVEERDILRQSMLAKDQTIRDTHSKFIEDLTVRWKATQRVKRDRVKHDLQYELATQKVQELRNLREQQVHGKSLDKGVNDFERNMKRLGITSGEGNDQKLSVTYEAKDAYERRLKDLSSETMPKDEEIEHFVGQLKERTAEKRAARYEKARRRRRALVDQANNASNDD